MCGSDDVACSASHSEQYSTHDKNYTWKWRDTCRKGGLYRTYRLSLCSPLCHQAGATRCREELRVSAKHSDTRRTSHVIACRRRSYFTMFSLVVDLVWGWKGSHCLVFIQVIDVVHPFSESWVGEGVSISCSDLAPPVEHILRGDGKNNDTQSSIMNLRPYSGHARLAIDVRDPTGCGIPRGSSMNKNNVDCNLVLHRPPMSASIDMYRPHNTLLSSRTQRELPPNHKHEPQYPMRRSQCLFWCNIIAVG